jgi:predicted dehydrogenase
VAFQVAVVGAGSMAGRHVQAFRALEGVRVAGITSRTRARAEKLASDAEIPVVADGIDDLYARTKADLVVVTVPELSANAVAKACFRHDWAVLLEKPAGYDLADAEDIAAAAAGRKRPTMVGFNRRYYSSVRAVANDLDARPAERRYIHVQDQQNYAEARRYNHPPQVVEKFMYANSIHNIDLIAHLGRGAVKDVKPITPWRGEETEIMLAYVEFESGDSALYEGVWKGPGPWTCSVSTPSRRWHLQPLEQARYQNADERTQHAVDTDDLDVRFKAGFYRQADAAVRKARGESSDIVDLEESLRTMRLIRRIFGV